MTRSKEFSALLHNPIVKNWAWFLLLQSEKIPNIFLAFISFVANAGGKPLQPRLMHKKNLTVKNEVKYFGIIFWFDHFLDFLAFFASLEPVLFLIPSFDSLFVKILLIDGNFFV